MILRFEEVHKKYTELEWAASGVSFEVSTGEFTALAGPSGSGKTTLLNLAAGLDTPTKGKIHLCGNDLTNLNLVELSQLRRDKIGFVFQSYNLFPILTALENVEYPLALKGINPKDRKKLAQKALLETGCGELGKRLPSQLSGGQQQRVAIARAIVTSPVIVFADEPTANLDSGTSKRLLQLFRTLNDLTGITFLFSSHDPLVLENEKRVFQVSDGLIKADSYAKKPVLALPPLSFAA